MAQVIENLLIGVGLDTDKKSFQNAEGSLDGLKSKALQLGAVVAGAFGVDALTFGFAEKTDELGKFSERWGIAANDVSAYDRALGLAGGTQGEFLGTVRNLSKALTLAPFERAQLLGELSKFGIGDEVNEVLSAGNALEAFLVSAEQLQKLQGKQREKFIEAMGFSESEVRLLSSGRSEIIKVVNQQKKMAPVTKQMTDTAALFNDEWQDLTTNLSGFSGNVAEPLTASIASIIAGMNEWADANRNAINSILSSGGEFIADNIGLITTSIALLGGAKTLGGLTAVAGKFGLISKGALTASKSASLLLGRLGLIGAAAGAGWAVGTEISERLGYENNTDIGRAIAKTLAFLGDEDAARALQAEQDVGGFTDRYTPTDGVARLSDFGEKLVTRVPTAPSPVYGTQPVVKVDVMLDGEPVKAITKQVILEEGEQVIQDFATSNRG